MDNGLFVEVESITMTAVVSSQTQEKENLRVCQYRGNKQDSGKGY